MGFTTQTKSIHTGANRNYTQNFQSSASQAHIVCSPQGTTIFAGGGNDQVKAHQNKDGSVDVSINGETHHFSAEEARSLTIDLGSGNDTFTASGVPAGANGFTVRGQAGNDTLTGSNGADTLDGGAGGDTIHAGCGNDTVNGGAGDDYISGQAGNDTIDGGDGVDTAKGGTGFDQITNVEAVPKEFYSPSMNFNTHTGPVGGYSCACLPGGNHSQFPTPAPNFNSDWIRNSAQ